MVSVSDLEFPVSPVYYHVLLLLYYHSALRPEPRAYLPLHRLGSNEPVKLNQFAYYDPHGLQELLSLTLDNSYAHITCATDLVLFPNL